MNNGKFRKEIGDYIKGIVSALIVAMLWSFFQYIGSHFHEIIGYVLQASAATGTIKLTRK